MKRSLLFFLVFTISLVGFAQKMDFLPRQNLWPSQALDPLASQSSAMVASYWEKNNATDFTLTTFGFGFQKSFFAWPKSADKAFDLGLEGTAFTQFEWTNRNETFQRNILSTDFWIGVPFVMYFRPWTIRIRFYHLSAHMGDDYMIRNKINSYIQNNVNYEQLDVTASYLHKNFRFYLGAGAVVRAAIPREPLVFTGGMDYVLNLNKSESAKFYAGFYADSKQEHGFSPAINMGAGVQLGKPGKRPIKILVTYFTGHLPYSIFEGESVQWFGVGIYINPF